MVLEYYISVAEDLKGEDLRRAVREVFPEREGVIMSTSAEQWVRDGRAKGIREGREQGIAKGVQEAAANLTLLQLERELGKVGAVAHPAFAGTQTARAGRRPARLHHGNGFNFLARQTISSDFGRAINGRRHKE